MIDQLPFALFIVTLFLLFGAYVRRGVITGNNIILAGIVVGAVAAVVSYFNVPAALRQTSPMVVLLAAPVPMAICAAVCTYFAYRAQQVVELASHAIGDTTVRARYSPAIRLRGDALLLPTNTKLRMTSGAPGAVGAAAGATVTREAKAKGPVGVEKVVRTTGGKLDFAYIFHAAVSEPLRSVDEAHLRRGLENAAQQARKSGAERVVAIVVSLPGLPIARVAQTTVDAVLKHRRAFSEIIFVTLEPRAAPAVRDAVAAAIAVLEPGTPS